MLIEQPPLLYRLLFPEAIWRLPRKGKKVVYLTFDDGPIPELTTWILDTLDRYDVKATFFMVGDNVRRNPELFEEIKRRGHSYGNHTMHHKQGLKTSFHAYIRDIEEANKLIDSTLFRPPHGLMGWSQMQVISEHYNIIMYDLVTRDYDRSLSSERIFKNVKRYARNGSIIVFHDSLKSLEHIKSILPCSIECLKEHGYEMLPIPM